ncbi:hypothetical protein KIN20_032045 [Parelaphostrongylus tenuis]|uniref:Uncharacterized protein n=1 Tax=Parelaphostrongylus tenuis TaxID=148309 RepID=A0AAD5R6C3_PARTN|nr:hypothetical protein KIN20_032045 [Parelaphostrongylus tenuis]
MKLRCYQCNQPYQCGHGICSGDICVKTSISQNNAYVSKGCENVTHAVSHYEPQMKLKSYCRTEVVFGIESTICYCRVTATFATCHRHFYLSGRYYTFVTSKNLVTSMIHFEDAPVKYKGSDVSISPTFLCP